MRALTWQGKRSVSVEEVPDPVIQEPTDAIVKITSSAICGSDLHLYEVLGPYMKAGDILGHEPMGDRPGGRPRGLEPQARRQGGHPVQHFLRPLLDVQARPAVPVRDHTGPRPQQRSEPVRLLRAVRLGPRRAGRDTCACPTPTTGRSRWAGTARRAVPLPFRHSSHSLAGSEIRRRPRRRDAGRLRAGSGGAVRQQDRPAPRPAGHRRRAGSGAPPHGREARRGNGRFHQRHRRPASRHDRRPGPDAVVDAVGMEAHNSPVGAFAQNAVGLLPDALAKKAMETAGVDRLTVLHAAIDSVRRGGTVSLSGVYGGTASPMPLLTMRASHGGGP